MRHVYFNHLGGAHKPLQSACNNLVLPRVRTDTGLAWGVCLGWIHTGNSCFLSVPEHSCCSKEAMQISVAAAAKSTSAPSSDEAERGPLAAAGHPRPYWLKQRSPPLLAPSKGGKGVLLPKGLLLRRVLSLCGNMHSSVHTSVLWLIYLSVASCQWSGRWWSSPSAQRTLDEWMTWINMLPEQVFNHWPGSA